MTSSLVPFSGVALSAEIENNFLMQGHAHCSTIYDVSKMLIACILRYRLVPSGRYLSYFRGLSLLEVHDYNYIGAFQKQLRKIPA